MIGKIDSIVFDCRDFVSFGSKSPIAVLNPENEERETWRHPCKQEEDLSVSDGSDCNITDVFLTSNEKVNKPNEVQSCHWHTSALSAYLKQTLDSNVSSTELTRKLPQFKISLNRCKRQ